jgi:hypothetical protein
MWNTKQHTLIQYDEGDLRRIESINFVNFGVQLLTANIQRESNFSSARQER